MKIPILLAIFLILITSNLNSEELTDKNISKKIAEAYGISDIKNIKQITFTFNASKGKKSITNSWKWDPNSSIISYKNKDTQGKWKTYNRDKMSDDTKEVDSHFINDKYWPLFPFQIISDSGVTVKLDEKKQKLPIGDGEAHKVIIKYGPEGGYTPGDIYELYIGDDFLIKEWVYKRNGSNSPGVITTWENYKQYGPFIIATDFKGKYMLYNQNETLHIWLTDIDFKIKGN